MTAGRHRWIPYVSPGQIVFNGFSIKSGGTHGWFLNRKYFFGWCPSASLGSCYTLGGSPLSCLGLLKSICPFSHERAVTSAGSKLMYIYFFSLAFHVSSRKGSRMIREGSTKTITQWGREGTASTARDRKPGRRRSLIHSETRRTTARLNSNG